jgi:hypothetical protein
MVQRFAPVGVQTYRLLPVGSGDVPVIAAVLPVQSRGSSPEDIASRPGGGAEFASASAMPSERPASASDRR